MNMSELTDIIDQAEMMIDYNVGGKIKSKKLEKKIKQWIKSKMPDLSESPLHDSYVTDWAINMGIK